MTSDKYPRTPHLPYSPGCTKDDRMLDSCDHLIGKPIILSEKVDGSNVCLECDSVFARSHNGPPNHPSFDWLKQFHATNRYKLLPDTQIFCEYLLAKHSIHYLELPHYLALIGMRNTITDEWLCWKSVKQYSKLLEAPTVPVLFEGTVESEKDLEKIVLKLAGQPSLYGGEEKEGVVIRLASSFTNNEFNMSIAKFVNRKFRDSIKNEHWAHKQIVRNKLKK
jgi:hypothetical protein